MGLLSNTAVDADYDPHKRVHRGPATTYDLQVVYAWGWASPTDTPEPNSFGTVLSLDDLLEQGR